MSQVMPPLRIIAQPKSHYRERYGADMGSSQRFVRADDNPNKYPYPTVEVPKEWTTKIQEPLYICVTLITVPNEQINIRYIHPYPINTEDTTVIKDSSTNSLYFPLLDSELISGQKSFQFTLRKLTQHELKEYGPLKLLHPNEIDQQNFGEQLDAKKLIEIYQLRQSQLLFSLATFQNGTQSPIIYGVSSVLSQIMATVTPAPNDDSDVRCSPQRGDWQGGEEVLMFIPKVDKRKAFVLRFVHPQMDPSSTVQVEFVDTKTISFITPKYPVPLTRNNPVVSVLIIATQGDIEVARVPFVYQSLDRCLTCNSSTASTSTSSPTTNKRSHSDSDETDEVQFRGLTLNRAESRELEHSRIRDFIQETKIKSEDQFQLLENAIREGNIGLALKLMKQPNNYLQQENDEGETPLLLAAKFNHNHLIQTILIQQPEFAIQVNKQGNNLLHILANVPEGKAKTTIENILTILDANITNSIISRLNGNKQTPRNVAENRGNIQYIDLLKHKTNFFNEYE